MKRILLTGAAGGVAGMVRPLLRQRYRLRLSDLAPLANARPDEEDMPADLADMDAVRRAVRGVEGLIHLGGRAVEDDWEAVHGANIAGAYNLFEAARLEGVERVVFASSTHAVGFYPRAQIISDDVTVRPDSRYGLSKAFGEALGSLYAHKYRLRVLSVRIGNVAEKPVDVRRLAIWVSPRDLVQLMSIGLEHPDIRNEIVYGMSDNKRSWWDNANAVRLGYRPADQSEPFAAEILASEGPAGDGVADIMQGGEFCVSEKI